MSVDIKNLDHLGLVAGIIDEIGIVEKINELIGEKKPGKISAGQVVKAMILNGLGLVSSPLYIFKDFFNGKAAEHLLGQEIKAEYLNDDRLGRVLDKMYDVGLNQIFMLVVIEIILKYQLKLDPVHLDSSSFHVHGQYNNSSENQTIEITHGYSRDGRPDLKQFVMELICTGDGDVPIWMKMCSGNSSDQKEFGLAMVEFKKQLEMESLMVADSAFYTQENLQITKDIKWLSRVPFKVKVAKELVKSVDNKDLTKSQINGYSYLEILKTYGAVKQRWLLVESEQRRESDLKKLEKKIKKDWEASQKKLRELSLTRFACTADAQKAASCLLKKSKYHELTDLKISEVNQSKSAESLRYKLEATVAICQEKVTVEKRSAGRFILATNVLNPEELTTEEIILKYKEQQSVERGFSFLKDPMFLTDSVFLKSAKRIESLGLIMGLCLLVYTLGQRELRHSLKKMKTGVKNQLGRLTDRPTLRWIFQCFQSVHVLIIEGVKQVSNLTNERLNILKFFAKPCQSYYLLV